MCQKNRIKKINKYCVKNSRNISAKNTNKSVLKNQKICVKKVSVQNLSVKKLSSDNLVKIPSDFRLIFHFYFPKDILTFVCF